MRQLIPALSLIMTLSAPWAHASSLSEKTAQELKLRIGTVKQNLAQLKTLREKMKTLEDFRSYLTREIQTQEQISQPDSMDNRVALSLIGYDDDLGSILDSSLTSGMDSGQTSFSEERCTGYRLALRNSYVGSGSGEAPKIPAHTEDSLQILGFLCKH